MHNKTVVFIGAGNMAHAMISGLVKSGYLAENIIATAPSDRHLTPLQHSYGIRITHDNLAAAKEADIVVLAVKPQLLAQVCEQLRAVDFSQKLVISVAAGVLISRLNELLGAQLRLVRVMPNTPSLVKLGMAGLFASEQANDQDKSIAEQLMSSVGKTCWLESEADINTVIAAAGSAPAYFFLLMQAMEEKAIALGLDKATARMLVQETALGAAQMVKLSPEVELETLREQVTSKGGTTFEAIKVFQTRDFNQIVGEAMQAAVERAQAMEREF